MSAISGIQGRMRRTSRRSAGIIVGAVAIAVAAALVYWLVLRGDGGASAQTGNRIEYQVQRGDITTSVSFSGTLAFAESEDLVFAGGGTVEELLVSEGDSVSQGDVIARLDAASTAALAVAVADAEAALSQAMTDYDNAMSGATARKDLAAAEKALAEAEMAVSEARNALLEVEAEEGTDSTAVAKARVALDSAQLTRDIAADDLEIARASEGLTEAETAAQEAADAYRDALFRWFGSTVPEEFHTMAPDDILSAWGVTLSELFGEIAAAQGEQGTPWEDNPETPWDEVTLWVWTSFLPTTIDPEALTSQSSSVLLPRAELMDAWDAYQAADEALDAASRDASRDISDAELALSNAESDLQSAQETLASLLDPAEYQSRRAALDEAEAERDEAAVALERAAALSDSKVRAAAAAQEIAQHDLADAEAALESSTMTAPFDGVVAAVNVDAGDEVDGTKVVATVVNTSALTVESSVDEEDILSVALGAPASVTLDAVAGRAFTGKVTSIGQAQESQQGAVTFPVTITLDDTGDLDLVEGLTAAAQVINSQTPDVLVVPVAAVAGTFLQPAVERVTENGSEMIPVELGSSNGTVVEIVSGLEEGDTVIATFASGLGLSNSSGQTFPPVGGGVFDRGGVTIIEGPDGGIQTFPGGRGGGRFPGGGNQ